MNVLILIDEVVCNDQKTLISFDFVRQCDYLEFANLFGLDSAVYEDINADSKIRGSFVQIENYHSSVPLRPDGYFYLNLGHLKDMKMRRPEDNRMYMAKFDFAKVDPDVSEPLFVKYTGIPHWLWPNTMTDWGLSPEEVIIQKSGHYELTSSCQAILDSNDPQMLIVPCWDKENMSSILQKNIKDIDKCEMVVCASAYLSHTVFSLLWWLRQRLSESKIQMIHNNLSDSNHLDARLLHQNKQFKLFVSPINGNRRDSGIVTIKI